MNERQIIQTIKHHIAQRGYTCADELIENFYLSLKARPFVLIGGRGDVDMALLPMLFAEAVGATEANGRFRKLTVRPDWMDSSDLFGWLNLEGKFIPGVIIDFMKAAQLDPEKPYFLCLDRVILSRAEYYLRDMLAAVESRGQEALPYVTMAYYGRDEAAKESYGVIPVLDNLYIIGTINLEETSLPLNQKLLDRVHTIRMTPEDLTGEPAGLPEAPELDNGFLATRYFSLEQCAQQSDVLKEYFSRLEEMNRMLSGATAYLGFRIRNDTILYLMHNRLTGVLPEDSAMDQEICMKVLTRIQGGSKMIKATLCKLFCYCSGAFGEFSPEQTVGQAMTLAAGDPACRYPRAAKHVARMVCLCETDGYASFWS